MSRKSKLTVRKSTLKKKEDTPALSTPKQRQLQSTPTRHHPGSTRHRLPVNDQSDSTACNLKVVVDSVVLPTYWVVYI